MKHLRQTGRSTRMLEAAAVCAEVGNYVFVVCSTPLHITAMKKLLRDLYPDAEYVGSDKVYIGRGSISFTTPDERRGWSWDTFRYSGQYPSCVVFIDHFAIEQRFDKLLDEVHRWDAEPEAAVEPAS